MFNFFKSQKQKDEETATVVKRLHKIAMENQKNQMQQAMMMKMAQPQSNPQPNGWYVTGKMASIKTPGAIHPGMMINTYFNQETGEEVHTKGCNKCGHYSEMSAKYCELCNEPMLDNFIASYGTN